MMHIRLMGCFTNNLSGKHSRPPERNDLDEQIVLEKQLMSVIYGSSDSLSNERALEKKALSS